jgi:DNA-binding NarL/FixJ family response regulator
MKVLIIDSSIAVVERLKEVISEEHLAIDCTHETGKTGALNAIQNLLPSVVIMDMHLPGNASFVLIKYLRKYHVNTFIIGLSIQADIYIKEKSKALGLDEFLNKYEEISKVPALLKEQYYKPGIQKSNIEKPKDDAQIN